METGICYSCDTIGEFEFKNYTAQAPCGNCGDSYIFLYYATSGLVQLTPDRFQAVK